MAAPGENLRINPDRLWDSLMEMAKIGPGIAGGNNRQTLTDEDAEGRALFVRTKAVKESLEAAATFGSSRTLNLTPIRDPHHPSCP
ncbi:MAG: Zn-dependent hydrolase, partial [Pseudomonadota bacterium]